MFNSGAIYIFIPAHIWCGRWGRGMTYVVCEKNVMFIYCCKDLVKWYSISVKTSELWQNSDMCLNVAIGLISAMKRLKTLTLNFEKVHILIQWSQFKLISTFCLKFMQNFLYFHLSVISFASWYELILIKLWEKDLLHCE